MRNIIVSEENTAALADASLVCELEWCPESLAPLWQLWPLGDTGDKCVPA